jgi:hypothetical protein
MNKTSRKNPKSLKKKVKAQPKPKKYKRPKTLFNRFAPKKPKKEKEKPQQITPSGIILDENLLEQKELFELLIDSDVPPERIVQSLKEQILGKDYD